MPDVSTIVAGVAALSILALSILALSIWDFIRTHNKNKETKDRTKNTKEVSLSIFGIPLTYSKRTQIKEKNNKEEKSNG
jgi:plastocyanin domain-containing protein